MYFTRTNFIANKDDDQFIAHMDSYFYSQSEQYIITIYIKNIYSNSSLLTILQRPTAPPPPAISYLLPPATSSYHLLSFH